MRSFILILITIVLVTLTQIFDLKGTDNVQSGKYVILLHGGAGALSQNISDSLKDVYYKSLSEALTIGKSILENDGTALDAVEKVINYLENNPDFNSGKGAVFTSEGTHELDASIMYGVDLSCGAVAGVKHIKNPISLARLVMEKSPHVLFAGDGAERFGKKMGVEFVENNYFHTPEQWKKWEERKKDNIKGTVGCVALDRSGNLAAGTSTGGMSGKMPGRVGDSPLVNAGTYANNKTCAVSATGWGELFIRNTIAFNISALMEYKNMTLKDAAYAMIKERLPKDSGGIIAVDRDGNYTALYNTASMLRGAADSEGKFEVKIWE